MYLAGNGAALFSMYPPPHMTDMHVSSSSQTIALAGNGAALLNMYPPPHMTCMYPPPRRHSPSLATEPRYSRDKPVRGPSGNRRYRYYFGSLSSIIEYEKILLLLLPPGATVVPKRQQTLQLLHYTRPMYEGFVVPEATAAVLHYTRPMYEGFVVPEATAAVLHWGHAHTATTLGPKPS